MLIQLPNAFGEAATNMAIDASLLETVPQGLAIFRHYGWLEPAATFGYAQFQAQVLKGLTQSPHPRETQHAAVIRRLTGGGIVDHRNDWTYALVLHRSLACAEQPATQLYKELHQAISRSLKTLDIENHLAPCAKACQPQKAESSPSSLPPQNEGKRGIETTTHCFITPAAHDVLRLDGRKIAGAAMKRSRQSLLIQGSVDRSALPSNFDFSAFQARLIDEISQTFALKNGHLEDLRSLFNSEIIERHKQRFQSATWNQRR